MRTALVTAFGGPEVLKVVSNHPVPKIQNPNEVLIKVAYAGLNPVDTYTRQGPYFATPQLPFTTGFDGAGIVEEVGSDVKEVKKGDRVWFTRAIGGATAEYALATNVFPLSKGLSFKEGAGIGIPYLTAYKAFFLRGHLTKDQTVLVHGASGGVGTAAVQIAVANGNVVAGTAGTPEGLELVRSLGAKVVSNHRQEGYEKKLLKEFPNGFDFIAENASHVNLERDFGLIAVNGEIATIGNRGTTEINVRGLMFKEASVFGLTGFRTTPEEIRQVALALNKLFETGVKPVIDKVYEIDEIAKAHEYIIASPGAKGNLVVRVADLE